MKHFYLKTLVLLLLAAVGQRASASSVIDGIAYNFDYSNYTASVTHSSRVTYTGAVVIPSSISKNGTTYSVTSIEGGAFQHCTGLTNITIPNSVTSIGGGAFEYCSGLTNITIPGSVTSIGGGAFYGCTGLTSVTIPNSVTSIGDYAFKYCTGLNNITIGNSVTSIGSQMFYGCTNLTSVTIGNSVTSIGESAFYNCTGLTNITIPNSVTYISPGVLNNTKWYSNQPDGIVYAGKMAYKYKGTMPNNTTVILEEGTNGIVGEAFIRCAGLTSITIPSSVTSIGTEAFLSCGLTSITIPSSVTSIEGRAFEGCTYLTSVTIPNSVTRIENATFRDCTGLTSVSIPNSVTSIGVSAFRDCTRLTSVTIGSSVTSIEIAAFECKALTHITCLATVPPECEETQWASPFDRVDKTACRLSVPSGSIEAYKAADVWKEFFNIDGEATGIDDVTNGAVEATVKSIYDLNGRQQQGTRRGLNIVRMSDGTVRKVMVR